MGKLDSASLTTLLDATQANSTLECLELTHTGLTPTLAVQIADFVETNRTITALDLTGNSIGSHGASCIAASLQKNSTIQSLSLADCGLKNDGVAPFVTCFQSRIVRLRSLDLSKNQIDDDAAETVGALVTAIAQLPDVTTLDLRHNSLADEAMRALAMAMQTNYSLLELRIEGNDEEDATIAKKQITFCLQRNRRRCERRTVVQQLHAVGDATKCLHELQLQHVELTLADAQLLSDGLCTNRSLVEILLRDNALPTEGTRRILKSLHHHPSLRTLQIHDNDVGDTGFLGLNELLRQSHTLADVAIVHSIYTPPPTLSRLALASLHHTLAKETLVLHTLTLVNCGLGDFEIGVIVSGIAWACRLEALDLHHNPFTDRCAFLLARLVHRCRRLHSLDVTTSQLTLDGALVVTQATVRHPVLRVLRLGRFPQYVPTTIDAITMCLRGSETLIRVELTTKERASRCADLVAALHEAWESRREAVERAWRHNASQQSKANERHARAHARVRHIAECVVQQWIQQAIQ